MTENRRQVLEMLASGRITAEEADRLLGALDASEAPASPAGQAARRPNPPRYMRVMVDAIDNEEGPVHINVRVPISLLRAGVRLASLIPGAAQARVNEALREQGIPFDVSQIKAENLNEVIDQLSDFSADIDHHGEEVKIKVFAE